MMSIINIITTVREAVDSRFNHLGTEIKDLEVVRTLVDQVSEDLWKNTEKAKHVNNKIIYKRMPIKFSQKLTVL